MQRKTWLVPEAGLLPLALLLGLALLATGCVTGPIRSQVLDTQTGQPVPGAIVLGVWTKTVGFGLTRTELVGVKEVEVDDQGRFILDRPAASYGEESVTVYKFGYVAWNNEEVFPRGKHRPDVHVPTQILLELFPGDWSHQEHIYFIGRVTSSGLSVLGGRPRFDKAIDRESRMR